MKNKFIHSTAIVEPNVELGDDVKIWHNCQVREGAKIEDNVSLGKDVFIDKNVKIGKGSRIQNGVSIYFGVLIDNWVFVGPNVTFTNDKTPRAGSSEWEISETKLLSGCSIGAGATILPDLTIGEFSLVGAGSVVTENIPPFHLAYGLPARVVSKICACGHSRVDFSRRLPECILDCCLRNLKSEVLALAREVISKLL
jgi:UDP-2-acetamido-3-amino-2,3-dideoxy-glucuronate N-acetyltransferase